MAKSFSYWLFKKRRGNSPVVDLASDAYSDKSWPRNGTKFSEFYNYIRSMGACSEAIDALLDAWSEYSGVDYHNVYRRCVYGLEVFDLLNLTSMEYQTPPPEHTYIYALVEIGEFSDACPFYVGQARRPVRRLRQHAFHTDKNMLEKIRIIFENGRAPMIEILECVHASVAQEYERAYIDMLGSFAVSKDGLYNVRLK